MKNSVTKILLTILMVVPLNAQAASGSDRFGPSAGDSEVQVSGSLTRSDAGGSNSTTLITQLGLGYHLLDPNTGNNLMLLNGEAEIGGQFFWIKSDGGFDSLSILPYGRVNYRLNERAITYAGVHLGLTRSESGSQSSTDLSFGLHGGLKHWLTPEVSGFVEGRWTERTGDFESTDLTILVGLSYTL